MPENDTALSDREEDMLEIKYNSKYKQKYKQKYRIGLITPRPPPSKE